ncbi:hypothetical protein V8F06_005759, partial [Rhypophila decipiens]
RLVISLWTIFTTVIRLRNVSMGSLTDSERDDMERRHLGTRSLAPNSNSRALHHVLHCPPNRSCRGWYEGWILWDAVCRRSTRWWRTSEPCSKQHTSPTLAQSEAKC